MSLLATQVNEFLEKSSWIRKMFEAGRELKKQHGEDRVFDFSLGNPDLPPPAVVGQALHRIADQADRPYAFGYMPNAGFPRVREKLAHHLSREQGTGVGAEDILLTCGAAGGLNCLFRTILEPGEEVVCPSPYFVEYGFYLSNHQGVFKTVPTTADFHLDIEAIDNALTERTRMVLINSPNNPTGQVYGREEIEALGRLLLARSSGRKRPIFLVSDEPYRFLTYDGAAVHSILPAYPYSAVVSSFSKNLAMAGERIGYVLLNPSMENKDILMDGLVYVNRILGYVNAPTIGQQVLEDALGFEVDVSRFERRRELMQQVLQDAGYRFTSPRGGFYFFPQAPGGDDVEFVRRLQDELVLAVPGSGFGAPGYFRLSFCVPEEVIERSASGFAKAKEGLPA